MLYLLVTARIWTVRIRRDLALLLLRRRSRVCVLHLSCNDSVSGAGAIVRCFVECALHMILTGLVAMIPVNAVRARIVKFQALPREHRSMLLVATAPV